MKICRTEAEKQKKPAWTGFADVTDPGIWKFIQKLWKKIPEMFFGGSRLVLKTLTSLVETLTAEWKEEGIPASEIHVAIHSQCKWPWLRYSNKERRADTIIIQKE